MAFIKHGTRIRLGERWIETHGRDINKAIMTRSGRLVWPLDPHVDDLAIEDVVWAISGECRFGNHISRFYSVSQHCETLSHMVRADLARWALVHDCAESFFRDLPSPIKQSMPEYKQLENTFMGMFAEWLGLDRDEPKDIKAADSFLTGVELISFFGEPGEDTFRARGVSEERIAAFRAELHLVDRQLDALQSRLTWLSRFRELFPNHHEPA